jgi:hypothetical protein
MTTLRDAVGEYLKLRRSLGFKLRETGKLLLAFVQFWKSSAPPTSRPRWRSPGRSNHRPCSPQNGRAA